MAEIRDAGDEVDSTREGGSARLEPELSAAGLAGRRLLSSANVSTTFPSVPKPILTKLVWAPLYVLALFRMTLVAPRSFSAAAIALSFAT